MIVQANFSNFSAERIDQMSQRPTQARRSNKETFQEKPMSARSSLFAFAAVAALAVAALVPGSASAAGNPSSNHVAKPVSKPVVQKGLIGHDKITYTPKKLIGSDPNTWTPKKKLIGGDPNTWTPKKKLIGGDPITWTPNGYWKHHHHRHFWWWFARQRLYYATPEVTTTEVSAPAVRATSTPAVSANCNCLTKEYLEDGSVVFKDLCTKEAAMATPAELKAQAQGATPQVR
jgi:hypothetical protein